MIQNIRDIFKKSKNKILIKKVNKYFNKINTFL
jgi:hypothetical protein